MDEIKIQATTMHQLTNAELFQANRTILDNVAPHVADVPRLQVLYDAYSECFILFDESVKKPLSAPETEEIKAFDTQRKGVFLLVDDAVRKNAHYSVIPDVQEAARRLVPIFDNFAGTPQIEYEGETAAVTNLIQDLEKPENVTRIARLGQTENVGALKNININFQALYETRLKNRYDFNQEGTTRQRGRNLINALVRFGRAIDGLILTASDATEIAALRAIIAAINAIMEQFTIIVHRRLGVKSSKKKEDGKDDDKKEDEGTQTPDTTNPAAPNTPPQNPDTTNPAINPDDLNPPAAGE